MIHYTCDRCKSLFDSASQTRYIVQMEVHRVAELSEPLVDPDDVDSLSELHQLLEGIESRRETLPDTDLDALDGDVAHPPEVSLDARDLTSDSRAADSRAAGIACERDLTEDASDNDLPTHRAHYELCPQCYRSFLRNPLGRDAGAALHFSKN